MNLKEHSLPFLPWKRAPNFKNAYERPFRAVYNDGKRPNTKYWPFVPRNWHLVNFCSTFFRFFLHHHSGHKLAKVFEEKRENKKMDNKNKTCDI